MNQIATITDKNSKSLVKRFANRYGVDEKKVMTTLKNTAFKTRQEIQDHDMMALMLVCDQHKLNPFTKEIFAFFDSKRGGIVPVVSVDGWARIINENPEFDGSNFNYSDELVHDAEHKSCPEWIECVIYRKDRREPTTVREYFDEVYRQPMKKGMKGPWQTHTKRMMRHKAFIQCARLAFGFAGIYDQDEAERIIEAEVMPTEEYIEEAQVVEFDSEKFLEIYDAEDSMRMRLFFAANNFPDIAWLEIAPKGGKKKFSDHVQKLFAEGDESIKILIEATHNSDEHGILEVCEELDDQTLVDLIGYLDTLDEKIDTDFIKEIVDGGGSNAQ